MTQLTTRRDKPRAGDAALRRVHPRRLLPTRDLGTRERIGLRNEPSSASPLPISRCGCLASMYLEQFALIVEDYDSALRFFVDALGFELVEDSPSLTNDGRLKRWVVVRPPGATSARCCSLRLMAGRKRVRSEVSSRNASACSCGSTASRPPTTAWAT